MTGRHRHPVPSSLDALLDGHDDGTALARLLGAARAPDTQREVAGLDAARAAFIRGVELWDAPARKRPVGRLLAVKVAAAVSGVSLIGGVAYATTSSGLLDHRPPPVPGSPTVTVADSVTHDGQRHHPDVTTARRSTVHAQPTYVTTPATTQPRATPTDLGRMGIRHHDRLGQHTDPYRTRSCDRSPPTGRPGDRHRPSDRPSSPSRDGHCTEFGGHRRQQTGPAEAPLARTSEPPDAPQGTTDPPASDRAAALH